MGSLGSVEDLEDLDRIDRIGRIESIEALGRVEDLGSHVYQNRRKRLQMWTALCQRLILARKSLELELD